MKIKIIISILTLIIIIILFKFFPIKNEIYKAFPNLKTDYRKHLFKPKSMINHLKNDYNVKFIPETEFLPVNFQKKKILFNKNFSEKKFSLQSFFIEVVDEGVIIVDLLGGFYIIKNEEFNDKNFSEDSTKKIDSNLSADKVLDSFIHKENLYVSFSIKDENCHKFRVAKAELNLDFLKFNNIFQPEECGDVVASGKMAFYEHEQNEGLLISTAEHPYDKPNNNPQLNESIYGKILFFDFKTENYLIFSKGHRNISGLIVKNNIILSTEHGPKAGDEINKILFNKNYGWPIASYGEKYEPKDTEKVYYIKNHKSLGFEEPIFVFIPALGISQIIELPNNFSNRFKENFIIASLNGRSIHRVKFDENYNKILFNEKIFIGQRIRDLNYSPKLNAILLALEEKGEIGVILNTSN
jgi:hypothetical protein